MSIQWKVKDALLQMEAITETIIRVIYTKKDAPEDASSIGILARESAALEEKEPYRAQTPKLSITVDPKSGACRWSLKQGQSEDLLLQEGAKELWETPVQVWDTDGEQPKIRRVHTVDGDRNFVENLRPRTDHMAWKARLHFCWQEGEKIHGLGQGEEGIYDYRGHVQYLYQHNMRIPMPWILSDRGYAILVDCGCLMTFNDDERGSYLSLDNVEQLVYYFIAGKEPEDLIRGYRLLTGRATLLPKWAFGYIQSRERYQNQEELVAVAQEYRDRGIGLDCVVQDWKTWRGDLWGEKTPDPKRFPDLPGMRRALHDLHVHSMVSIWPNMNYDTRDCAQMQKAGCLLSDLATYDAFSREGQKLFWAQAEEGLYREGFDSWWCDSTEPFSGPDWGGEVKREPWERYHLVGEEHKKFLGAQRANLYALAHAEGMYRGQLGSDPTHRMLNLSRSGYAGIQRYGVMLWSGDTAASWETLRIQITESLNMALSGYPWWTLDIGAFFTVKENWQGRGCGCHTDPTPKWFWTGDFEGGMADPGYRELYVRWLQMGVFLPMMRSHGTDTPREIWQLGEPGDPFYDAAAEAIALRYRLMPYIYSLAGAVVWQDGLMQRPLLLDFPEDARAAAADDAWMFGSSLLVCPVTEPMDYLPGGVGIQTSHTKKCYLPAGCGWTEFATGRHFAGGREVELEVPIGRIPVFVKDGSILPMEEELLYAEQKAATPMEVHIYPGADADFVYYEDAGDGYDYAEGVCNRIPMHWDDQEAALTIGGAGHQFDGGLNGRVILLICGQQRKQFKYQGKQIKVSLG